MKSQAERRITKSNPDLIYKIGLKGYVVSNSQIAKRELQLERRDNNENHLVGYNQGCTEKRLKMYTRDLNVWVRNYFGRKYFGLLTKESNIDLICGLKTISWPQRMD